MKCCSIRSLAVALCAISALTVPVARAAAGSKGPFVVQAHFVDAGGQPFKPVCDPTDPSLCTFQVDGSARFTGGLTGVTKYHAVGTLDPSHHGMDYELHETLTGVVAACGTGTVTWIVRGALNDESMKTYDPATGTVAMHNTVTIVDGSGTAELVGLTGSFLSDGRLNPLTFENHGDFHGSVTCGRRSRKRR